MAEIHHLENRHDVIFFWRGWSDFHKISEIGAEWHVDCGDVVKIKIQMWNSNMADVWANLVACHPSANCHTAGCCHLANSVSWFQSYVSHCRVLPLGKFNGMSSQSHISHCRVLPLGDFTVTIPEPHATLHGAVMWWNQCHDWSCHIGGCNNSICHIENYFLPYFIYFFVLKSGGFRIVSDTLVWW